MRKKIKALMLLFLLFGGVYIAFDSELFASKKPLPLTPFFHASIGSIYNVLIAEGKVGYDKNIVIKSDTNALVSNMFVADGDYINTEERLIQLENPLNKSKKMSLKLELKALNIKLASTNEDLDISKELFTVGGIAKSEINKHELIQALLLNDIEKLKLDLKRMDLSHQMALIKSPITGLVTTVFVSKNQQVNVGDKLISLVGGSKKHIYVYIDAFDIEKIWLNQLVTFSEREDSDATKLGHVINISKDITNSQRLNSVKVTIESVESIDNLLISQQLYIEFIIVKQLDVLKVPRELVYTDNTKKVVYTLTDKGIVSKEISVELGDSNFDIVTSGINTQDKLVKQPKLGD